MVSSNEDSSMSDGVQFFEGVEKLLEIWFTTSDGNNKSPDLRKIPRFVSVLLLIIRYILQKEMPAAIWFILHFFSCRCKLESLLKIVRCEIISFVKNDQIDAYVLR